MRKLYFENIHIMNQIDILSECVGKQDYISVLSYISALMGQLSKCFQAVMSNAYYFAEAGMSVTQEGIVGMLQDLLTAQENEDYVLYGDLLKLQIVPFLNMVQEAIRNQEGFFYDETLWEKNMQSLQAKDDKLYEQLSKADSLHEKSEYQSSVYGLECTGMGAFTLALEDDGKRSYIHSNENPYREARQFADAYFDVRKAGYLGLGLGLGYHWEALVHKNPNMELTICEPDIGILQLAFTYMDMSWYLQSENVRICYDPDYQMFHQTMDKVAPDDIVMVRPYLKHIKIEMVRQLLEECLVRENNIRLYKDRFYLNFKENVKHCQGYVDALQLQGKKVVLIAGGPSLDQNVEQLKNKPENTVYIAVGTVFGKLLKLGIPMDYVIITDPKEEVYRQVDGLEQEQIPMMLLSTAYGEIGKRYQGKKYLICQYDYDMAETCAKEHGYQLYHTGGSVMTTALDVAIRQKAKEIIVIGLDLAFTNQQDHASDVKQIKEIIAEGRLSVPAIGGGMVETIRPLFMYKKWIENRLTWEDVCMPVYDATEGGAVIAGARIVRLEEVL